MGLILCMAGAAGALVSVLAIAVLCLMGKKAGVPLGLFALCAAVMLASGLLPGGSGTERPPRGPGEIRGTPVTSAVRPAARDPESGEDPEPVRDPEPGESAGSALPAADIPAVDIPETEASASAGEMAAVLESILRESYTGCQVTSENGDITADIWSDGLGDAVAAHGIPSKIYVDNGCSYSNEQLSLICGSIGTVLLHTKIRDGSSKVKIEHQFSTLKETWIYTLDLDSITSLAQFGGLLRDYMRTCNTSVHSGAPRPWSATSRPVPPSACPNPGNGWKSAS